MSASTFALICASLADRYTIRVSHVTTLWKERRFVLTVHTGALMGDVTGEGATLDEAAVNLQTALDRLEDDQDLVPSLESSLAFVAARKKVGT